MVFFCDSLLSLVATIALAFFLFADVDLPRPAPFVTPPIAPPAVVIIGVTASVTGTEVGVAKIGAIFAVPLVATGAVEVAAATPDGVVDAAAAAAEDDAVAGVAGVGETTFAKDFFLSSAKDAVAAASAAATATALDLEASSAAVAAASAAAFAAAASAASQAFAAAIRSDGICDDSSKFGC